MLGFRGTFSRVGKPCSVSGERFPGQEKLARFQGDIFPSGKSLLRSAAILLRAGKPCCVLRQHFYEREKLAAFCGNTFTSGKSLLRFAATFLRAWKPCCAPRQHYYEPGNLAAFCGRLSTIVCLSQSFPFAHIRAYAIRPYTFRRNTYTKLHHPSPCLQRTNGKYVGAYRIRPPRRRK